VLHLIAAYTIATQRTFSDSASVFLNLRPFFYFKLLALHLTVKRERDVAVLCIV
jgi:hypothetical protein